MRIPQTLAALLLLLATTGCFVFRPTPPGTPVPPPPPGGETPAEATPSSPAAEPASEETANDPAQDSKAAPLDAILPVDPAIRVGRFDNGFKYYIRQNSRPEERAELRLFVDAGSLLEDDDQQGLAHFVEHMAFNGTRNFEKQELVDYLEKIGMRFGPDLNAYTSFDETVYMLRVPTDDGEILATAFQILEDWAHGVVMEGEEIDKERGVVVEEWRLGLGAQSRLRDQQLPVIFKDSRYAERLPIGKKEILEEAPYEAFRRYYRDWYRPDLMALVAVGDFETDAIEELVRKHFAALENPVDPRPRERYGIPGHEETLFSIVTDPELPSTNVSIYYKHPKAPQGTYGDYRDSLVAMLYNGMLNARLSEITQQADPPFVYAVSSSGGFVRTADVYYQAAGVREGEVERGLRALLEEVARVDRHGFTATELERIKKDVLRGYEQAFRERDKLDSASFAAEYGRNFLEDEPIPGIGVELAMVRRFLPTIDLAEVNDAAREWISDDNRVILVTGPEKEGVELPTEEQLLAVFDEASAVEVAAYEDQVRDAPLLASPPTPSPIVDETQVDEIDVTEWRLANGVRVILKPTDFRNDQVILGGFSPGGNSLVEDQHYPSAIFATSILGESGFGDFSRRELDKALAGKVAGAGTEIGELDETISGFASPEDLETMFQLIYLSVTEPRLDDEAFQSLLSRLRVFIANREKSPQTIFGDRLTEVLSQDHPRRQPISEEMLEEIDPQRALAIYRDRFADASDFVFVLVGNLDLGALRPLVETYLGGLPVTDREETWRDVGVERPRGVVEVEVFRGLEPKSQVQLFFNGPANWSRESVHQIGSLAQALRIRLREVLREDLGAVYGVGVSGSLSRRPREEFNFAVSFSCAPEEVDHLVATVFEEMEKIQREGVGEEYIAKVQETQRRKRETDLKENGVWLSLLRTYYGAGIDPRKILAHEELVDGVTPESIAAAAQRYFDRDNYVLGVLHPESFEEAAETADEGTADAEK